MHNTAPRQNARSAAVRHRLPPAAGAALLALAVLLAALPVVENNFINLDDSRPNAVVRSRPDLYSGQMPEGLPLAVQSQQRRKRGMLSHRSAAQALKRKANPPTPRCVGGAVTRRTTCNRRSADV